MPSSQKFIPIEKIEDNLVYLNNGSVCLILTTSAVNFALLFETEQYSIIESFAGLLNSLSFPIQIIVRSKRLDVSSYLATLDRALKKQTNPLLSEMTEKYKKYVESLIKENNVLDKKFYVCLNVSMIELGILSKSSENRTKKALTALNPRKDHIIRQLSRIGLKSKQLNTIELVELFYDIYNPSYSSTASEAGVTDQIVSDLHKEFTSEIPIQKPQVEIEKPENYPLPQPEPIKPIIPPSKTAEVSNIPSWIQQDTSLQKQAEDNPHLEAVVGNNRSSDLSAKLDKFSMVKNLTPPFVVEELVDEVWPKQSE